MKSSQDYKTEALAVVETAEKENRELSDEERSLISELKDKAKAQAKVESELVELREIQAPKPESRGRVFTPDQSVEEDLPTDKKRGGFNVLRAAELRAEGKPLDGLEAEVNAELEKKYGKRAGGMSFFMPKSAMEVRMDSTDGTGAIPVGHQGFIDYLRNKTVLLQAGATVLGDLSQNGSVSVPRQNSGSTVYWVGTDATAGDTTASSPTIDTVTLTPKQANAYVDITRSMRLQASVDIQALVTNDLVSQMALAVDYGCLYGTGENNQPSGILRDSNTNLVTCGDGTNGEIGDYADFVEAETKVSEDNALLNSPVFIVTPGIRGFCKTTDITADDGTCSSPTGRMIWENVGRGSLLGYDALVSNQMPSTITVGNKSNCHSFLFGDFSQVVIGLWSGIQITVDPYSLSRTGALRLVCQQDMAVALRQPVGLARCVDFALA